jgi:hypothetical protein
VFSAVKRRARGCRSFEYLAHDALPRRRQTPAPSPVAPTQNVREPFCYTEKTPAKWPFSKIKARSAANRQPARQ